MKTCSLTSPIVLLSGTVSPAVLSFSSPESAGAVVLKTVTLEPREPNPAPRMWDLGFGLLNSIGLFNPGINGFCEKELPRYRNTGRKLVISLAEFSTGSFKRIINRAVELFERDEQVIGYELNFSCPNVEKGGMAFIEDLDAVENITAYLRLITAKEVWVKLSPAGFIEKQADAALTGGATALCVANTMPAVAFDEQGKPVPGRGSGGLSGPGLKPINLLNVAKVRRAFPEAVIIASGGINGFDDIVDYRRAGADLFGLGSVLFKNPDIPDALYQRLKEEGLD